MKNTLITLLLSIVIMPLFAQGIKVGIEGNYGQWQRYGNINATFNKGKWFIKPAFKYGYFGKSDSISLTENPYIGIEMEPTPIDSEYLHLSYWSSSTNIGFSPEIELGYTFGKEEKRSSFVVALSFAYYWLKDDHKIITERLHIQTAEKDRITVSSKEKVKHQNYSIGLSLYYGFKLNEKFSLLLGYRIPYYRPVVSNHYNPNRFEGVFETPLMLNFINPELSLGINYKIK